RRRFRSCGRTRAAADEGGDAAGERHVHLLRADEMNMCIDAAGSQDQTFGGHRLGGRADDHVRRHARHHVGVAGLADAGDPPVLHADIGLVDAGPIDHERVGDYQIERVLITDTGRLSHAVAQHFATAELALVAVHGVVALHLGNQIRIAEPDAIAFRGTVNVGVVPPWHAVAHARDSSFFRVASVTGPAANALPPRTIRAPAISTSETVLVSPGSNRTAVPAGILSRRPYAAARSKVSARFVSAK